MTDADIQACNGSRGDMIQFHYRGTWERAKARRAGDILPPEFARIPESQRNCMYLGDVVRDAAGNPIREECTPCGDKRIINVFHCHHIGHEKYPRTTTKQCEACPDKEIAHEDVEGLDIFDMGMATSLPRRPTLCHADGSTVDLKGHFAGRTAFFLGGGPSLGSLPLAEFHRQHIITLGVNNVAELFTPTIWMCVDPPSKFPANVFANPFVWKLIPRAFANHPCADGKIADDHPSIMYFRRNARFNPRTFLTEPTFNWGNRVGAHDGLGYQGGRSVMFSALKMLWYLGCSRVVLLGCDFHMEQEQPYAHSERKDARGIRGNNLKFECVNARLKVLRGIFDDAGFTVLNGTTGSQLTAFPAVDPMELLAVANTEI